MYENTQIILVSGKSASGKSACLRNLENPEGVLYLNCEAGKRLPFRAKFMGEVGKGIVVEDVYQLEEAFTTAENNPAIHTIVIDTLTYLLEKFESDYIYKSSDSRAAWGDFQQYFKRLMQDFVARSRCTVIFLAHTADVVNGDKIREVCVPVKGALKSNGIESYFGVVISTKKMRIEDLEGFENDLLTITPAERRVGFKHVFQTQLTEDTVNERIRGPMGMWSYEETYIDNDIQLVMNRLKEYFGK